MTCYFEQLNGSEISVSSILSLTFDPALHYNVTHRRNTAAATMSTSTSFAMSALRSALPRAGPSKCRMPAASAARLSARFASTSTESTSSESHSPTVGLCVLVQHLSPPCPSDLPSCLLNFRRRIRADNQPHPPTPSPQPSTSPLPASPQAPHPHPTSSTPRTAPPSSITLTTPSAKPPSTPHLTSPTSFHVVTPSASRPARSLPSYPIPTQQRPPPRPSLVYSWVFDAGGSIRPSSFEIS